MARLMIERTFLRAQRENGQWDVLSMRELSHAQFRDWAVAWYARAGATLAFGPTPTTPAEREGVLRHMVEMGIPPSMLRE